MMKKLLFILLAFATQFNSLSQQTENCGTDQKRAELLHRNPFILQQEMMLDDYTRDFIQSRNGERSDQVYIIPVVFHIIHQNGIENISDEQVYDAVNILNRDFRKDNADTSDIVDQFTTIAADAKIEFRLATKDFMGNCTNGIDRIYSTETYVGDDGSKLNSWPRHYYLNIWVVNDMANGVAGYAYYPAGVVSNELAPADGVIIRHNYVGSIGTSDVSRSRSLTHEVGHYLNLQHTWGNNNNPGVACGDDNVEDTPVTLGWTSCNLDASVCEDGVVENVQNYMEYSYCSRMFTEGQALRMEAALNSTEAGRSILWQPTTLANTGTDGINDLVCAPDADFYPERPIICAGDDVFFVDNSTKGERLFWTWSFQDGEPAVSTEQHPNVTFNSPGWKEVTLTCGNDYGASSKTIVKSVMVSPPWSEVDGLIHESFVDPEVVNYLWVTRNLDLDESYWKHYEGSGFDDNSCVMLNAFDKTITPLNMDDNELDELITPSMDLSALDEGVFSFKYSFATTTSQLFGFTDTLWVYSTSNCGNTWNKRLTLSGIELVTSGNNAGYFVPDTQEDWMLASFEIPGALEQDQVRFKFVFKSGAFGNNLFIDDVNIEGVVGIGDDHQMGTLHVYPNPAASILNIDLSTKAEVTVADLYDLQGRLVLTSSTAASANLQMDVSDLEKGIYLLKVMNGSGVSTRLVEILTR